MVWYNRVDILYFPSLDLKLICPALSQLFWVWLERHAAPCSYVNLNIFEIKSKEID